MNSNKNILFVEDNSVDRLLFDKFAKRINFKYKYFMVSSIEDALVQINKTDYDAIVCDYNLGDGTALDLIEKYPEIPIIIVTGLGSEKIAVDAMRTGAYDYLIKDSSGNYLETIPITLDKALQFKHQQNELTKYQNHLEDMVAERTQELKNEINAKNLALEKLGHSQEELSIANIELKQKNILLKGVLTQIEFEKNMVHENIALNIERNIKPILKKIYKCLPQHDERCCKSIHLIEQYLNEINNDFFKRIENLKINLTPTEIKIAHFIKSGTSQKEIADILNVSLETIKGHTKNIRKKIGITNKKITLKNYFEEIPKT